MLLLDLRGDGISTIRLTNIVRQIVADRSCDPSAARSGDDGDVPIPETDLHRIQRWCRDRVPEHLWSQVKVEADVEPRHVTIVEVRPPWDGSGERTRFPIARLCVWAILGSNQ